MKKRYMRLFLIIQVVCCSFLFAAPVEIIQGSLKLVMYPDKGNFSLYQLSDIGKNRYEPLFEDRNSSITSWFSVQSNGRVFRLEKKAGKPVLFEQTPTGAKYTFILTDDFQVVQEFSFILSATTQSPIGLRIDSAVENTSGKDGSFALKAVFDTNLGETEGIHFFTNIQNRISFETKLEKGKELDSYIVSKNRNQSLMFLLAGNIATQPEILYVANWDRLNTLTWRPEFVEGRSFNTLYSVNDSALLFIWPEVNVTPSNFLRATMVLGPYTQELVALTKNTATTGMKNTDKDQTKTVAPPRTDNQDQNARVTQILARIAEIQANPDTASDDELEQLNKDLDILLTQRKE